MPSVSSLTGADLVSTAFGVAALPASASVIAFALLPFAPLQAEPRHQDRSKQEGDHRGGDRCAFAEIAAEDGALVGECRHQMCRVHRSTFSHHPDELEIG